MRHVILDLARVSGTQCAVGDVRRRSTATSPTRPWGNAASAGPPQRKGPWCVLLHSTDDVQATSTVPPLSVVCVASAQTSCRSCRLVETGARRSTRPRLAAGRVTAAAWGPAVLPAVEHARATTIVVALAAHAVQVHFQVCLNIAQRAPTRQARPRRRRRLLRRRPRQLCGPRSSLSRHRRCHQRPSLRRLGRLLPP